MGKHRVERIGADRAFFVDVLTPRVSGKHYCDDALATLVLLANRLRLEQARATSVAAHATAMVASWKPGF